MEWNMNKLLGFIFVGEFSYALNWYVPWLRKQCHTKYKDFHNIIFTFPNLKKLYDDFISEYHPLPDHIINELKFPATVGQHINGHDVTPSFIHEYIKTTYPDIQFVPMPHLSVMDELPDGEYKHYHSSIETYEGVKDLMYDNKFNKENTILYMPKTRTIGGKAKIQNWSKENWELLANRIIKELNYNIISLYFPEKNFEGGSHKLNIDSNKYLTVHSPSFDMQLALLEQTKFSIYGSTGANNLPFFTNTPMITYVHSYFGGRLTKQWQKNLTNNHEKQEIVLVDNLDTYTVDMAVEKLKEYVKNKL